jgi:Zn-dependent protease with chaperone function
MTVLVYLPLVLPVLVALVARPLSATGRPELTARVLAACAAVAAWASAGSLALLALTLLDDLPAMEVREHRAGALLPEPVPGPVAAAALLLLAWTAYRWRADLRRRHTVTRDLHAAGTPHDGLLVADWAEPHAVAVPAGAGHDGHVLVTGGLLRLLDQPERAAVLAHEQAHLRRRHHRTVAFGAAAAAVNPLLSPVADLIRLLVERSADEDAAAVVGDRALVARVIAKVALAGTNRAAALEVGASHTVRRVDALTRPTGDRSRGRARMGTAAALVLGSVAAAGGALADFVRVAVAWLSAS